MTMAGSNYALRLQGSLKDEAEKAAKSEGTTLNQFINVAVAEKLATIRTAAFFEARARGGNLQKALDALSRSGRPGKLRKGDEIPKRKSRASAAE
jgi:hypothetical protein